MSYHRQWCCRCLAFVVVAVVVAVVVVLVVGGGGGVALEKWKQFAMLEKGILGYFQTQRNFVFAWKGSLLESR